MRLKASVSRLNPPRQKQNEECVHHLKRTEKNYKLNPLITAYTPSIFSTFDKNTDVIMRDNVMLTKVDFNLRKYLASKRHAARKFNIPNPHAITFRDLCL